MTVDEGIVVTIVFYELKEEAFTCTFDKVNLLVEDTCFKLSHFLDNPDQLAIANHVWAALKILQENTCGEGDP